MYYHRVHIGKFTRTGKFRLHITALNVIAPHARYKVRFIRLASSLLSHLFDERRKSTTYAMGANGSNSFQIWVKQNGVMPFLVCVYQ